MKPDGNLMDRGRFEKLVDRYKDRIYTFAFYFLGNREDAEDATQEVLVKIWEKGDTADSNHIDGWIAKVTRNICIDMERRRRRWKSEAWEVAQCPDPETELMGSEVQERVRRAILGLPGNMREVVILRDIQGLPYREICDMLGISLSQLKVSLYRARKRLKELLEPFYRDYEEG